MKTIATVLLLSILAVPAAAVTVWDEGVDGDLSTSEAAPTALVLSPGSSTIIGTVNGDPLDRDYITFTIPAGQVLSHLNLHLLMPSNLAFSAFNAGATSFVPSGATIGSFLSGIHVFPADVGQDLLPFFVSRSVTTNALPAPSLGPGTYCWMIQQTSPLVQAYEVEFVIDTAVPTQPSTWGKVKALYR